MENAYLRTMRTERQREVLALAYYISLAFLLQDLRTWWIVRKINGTQFDLHLKTR